MFTTITLAPPPEDLFGRIKYNLFQPKIVAEMISVPDGCDFLKLTVPMKNDIINWKKVRQAAGKSAMNLVLPKWISVPYSAQLERFRSDSLARYITVNSAKKLLEIIKETDHFCDTAIVDYCGFCSEMLYDFPEFVSNLTIITMKPEKFENLKLNSMKNYGAAIRLTDDIAKAFDKELVIIPSPVSVATAFSRFTAIIAADGKNIFSSRVLCADKINLPEKYEALRPEGVSPLYFGSALYDISGVSGLAECYSPSFSLNSERISYTDAIKYLDLK